MSPKNKKVIIFDFDGTIVDSIENMLDIINGICAKLGRPQIQKEEIEDLRQMTLKQVVMYFDISFLELPAIMALIRKDQKKHLHKLKFVEGIREVLEQLHMAGHRLGILTSNNKKIVDVFLAKKKLNVFDFVHSEKNIFGKDKALKNFIEKNNLSPSDIAYVGDEIRDIEAAKKTGITVIAVGWGFNSPEILLRYEPDYLFHKPEELVSFFINQTEGVKE